MTALFCAQLSSCRHHDTHVRNGSASRPNTCYREPPACSGACLGVTATSPRRHLPQAPPFLKARTFPNLYCHFSLVSVDRTFFPLATSITTKKNPPMSTSDDAAMPHAKRPCCSKCGGAKDTVPPAPVDENAQETLPAATPDALAAQVWIS